MTEWVCVYACVCVYSLNCRALHVLLATWIQIVFDSISAHRHCYMDIYRSTHSATVHSLNSQHSHSLTHTRRLIESATNSTTGFVSERVSCFCSDWHLSNYLIKLTFCLKISAKLFIYQIQYSPHTPHPYTRTHTPEHTFISYLEPFVAFIHSAQISLSPYLSVSLCFMAFRYS